MTRRTGFRKVAALAVCLSALAMHPLTGLATTNSTQVINGVGASGGTGSAGSAGLTLATPATIPFSVLTLTGANQTTSATAAIDVIDASGNGSGWNVQVTSTSFTATGPLYLPGPVTAALPSWACTSGSTCTAPTNSGITYAMTVPQPASPGGVAPTPAKLLNSAANTGMGDQNTSEAFTMAVPANVRAGNFSSTWTFSYASAP
jgi:hypothetical protein